MYATSSPVPMPDWTRLLWQVDAKLSYLNARAVRHGTTTAERASIYGQQKTIKEVYSWVYGIVTMELPDSEKFIHLRQVASFIKANHKRERLEAAAQERQRLNSLEWHQLITGQLTGYEFSLSLLAEYGVQPLR